MITRKLDIPPIDNLLRSAAIGDRRHVFVARNYGALTDAEHRHHDRAQGRAASEGSWESVCKLLMLNAADGSQCGNPFRYVATVG